MAATAKAKVSQYSDEDLARAFALGQAGFAAGKKAACQDAELMSMIPPNSGIGTGIPLYTAWNKGFHSANLAAPIPPKE